MWIKFIMNLTNGKDAIVDVIDIIQLCHIFTIVWTVVYDEFKPLEK